jgi:hypothetical protein
MLRFASVAAEDVTDEDAFPLCCDLRDSELDDLELAVEGSKSRLAWLAKLAPAVTEEHATRTPALHKSAWRGSGHFSARSRGFRPVHV